MGQKVGATADVATLVPIGLGAMVAFVAGGAVSFDVVRRRHCGADRGRRRRPVVQASVWNPFEALWAAPPPPLDLENAPAVAVKALNKSFRKKVPGSRRRESFQAVRDLDFEVQSGRIFSLLGPNASGKTTALRCLATLAEPDSGSIEFYGMNALKYPTYARQLIGFVEQNAGLDKVLTGREHLELFADLNHLDSLAAKRNIEQLIQLLRLEKFVDDLTGTYSGGIKKRLDIAMALIGQPAILLLDEPTAALDLESRSVIWDILRELRHNGCSIVITSHYLEEVDSLSDSLLIMDRGECVARGTPSKMKEALGGDRIAIRIEEFTTQDRAANALQVLREDDLLISGIVNENRGNSLELIVKSGPDRTSAAQRIRELLEPEMGGEPFFSFSQSRPSLGDVYLNATGRDFTDEDMSGKDSRDAAALRKEAMR